MHKLGLAIVVLLVAACGGEKKDSRAAAKPLDLAAVNALVPAALRAQFEFVATDVVEARGHRQRVYTVAAPKGWKQESTDFATLKPDRDLGFMTELRVGTNCDGMCGPKDWAATVEKVYASYLAGKVIEDRKGDHTRTIIAESGDTTLAVVAWWEDGAREYWDCTATLDAQVKDLAPAFAKACEVVNVREE